MATITMPGMLLSGLFADRPAANSVGKGTLYACEDTGQIYQTTDGATWDAWGAPAGAVSPYTPPVNGDFSWVNQGGASVAVVDETIVLSVPASGTKENRLRVKSAPATPYTIDAYFRVIADPSDFWNAGLCFRQSGTGEIHAFSMTFVTAPLLTSTKFTSPTAYDSDYRVVSLALIPHGPLLHLRIEDDGVDRICSFSADGTHYQEFSSIGRTDFLTADQVGFWANSENSEPVTMTLYHWLEA